ncbi:hypothetical protein O181_079456 [Austropuccinia psidii MF-1]|uniref:CNNM transmembrane domain-containing protein n=1 Tax=Austropuccinia psidii MF-1 TaxID=1389203 RepID=A0A9Q3IDZ6_9BASI|nr:hypothetical protein [Austropuccinia psidii MF-1]
MNLNQSSQKNQNQNQNQNHSFQKNQILNSINSNSSALNQSNQDLLLQLNQITNQNHHHLNLTIILIPLLVLFSGLCAGLTIGYMSLDSTQLIVLSKSGTPHQKKLAQKIAPLRKDGHLLLITLLIANMIANEALPIVTEKSLGSGLQAVIISTVLVIIFSEIIPQSVCATYGLQIGAACALPVKFLVYLIYPIAWPISFLMTKILGHQTGTIYRRAELKELINLHSHQGKHGGDLANDVVTIVGAALDMQERIAQGSMTPLDRCFMLHIDTQLNYETMTAILASGHSRVPIYENTLYSGKPGRKIIGALLTKQLILIDPQDGLLLRNLPLNPLPVIASDTPLLNILNSFQEGRSHLAVVCPRLNDSNQIKSINQPQNQIHHSSTSKSKSPYFHFLKFKQLYHAFNFKKSKSSNHSNLKNNYQLEASLSSSPTSISNLPLLTDQPIGIISLEDILEALLGEQIYDETDLDEHGHIAVPPYVPHEVVVALGKNSNPINSNLTSNSNTFNHSKIPLDFYHILQINQADSQIHIKNFSSLNTKPLNLKPSLIHLPHPEHAIVHSPNSLAFIPQSHTLNSSKIIPSLNIQPSSIDNHSLLTFNIKNHSSLDDDLSTQIFKELDSNHHNSSNSQSQLKLTQSSVISKLDSETLNIQNLNLSTQHLPSSTFNNSP